MKVRISEMATKFEKNIPLGFDIYFSVTYNVKTEQEIVLPSPE